MDIKIEFLPSRNPEKDLSTISKAILKSVNKLLACSFKENSTSVSLSKESPKFSLFLL